MCEASGVGNSLLQLHLRQILVRLECEDVLVCSGATELRSVMCKVRSVMCSNLSTNPSPWFKLVGLERLRKR
jgi:hypothetical protein